MKKFITYFLIGATIAITSNIVTACTVPATEQTTTEQTEATTEHQYIKVLNTDDCTEEILLNRIKDKNIIIERIEGICLDASGNGKITNTNSEYNYISYRSVEGIKPGDKVLTYCIYDLSSTYTDDVISRTDFIINK